MKKAHLTILVVDDDSNDLMFIQAAFKAVGAASKIRTVESGYEALAYVKGEGIFADRSLYPFPDYVITDLKMPGMDGFAVLAYLKKNPKSATIPTIIFSSSQDNDDITKAYLLGANSYLVKPSAPAMLRVLVKALHDYWLLCEAPESDGNGKQLDAKGSRKLGERSMPVAR